jgi:hypothetical protein
MVADWEYSYNGYTFGGAQNARIIEVLGLTAMPSIREDLSDKVGGHGGFAYMDRFEMRRVTMTGDVVTSSMATLETERNLMMAAFGPKSAVMPLIFKRPGLPGSGQHRLYCKPSRAELPLGLSYSLSQGFWAIQFVAEDPLIYDDSESSVVTPVTTPSGIANAGNMPTNFHSVLVTGPGTTFTLRQSVDTTKALKINTTLTGAQSMTINFIDRTIIRNDAASLYGSIDASTGWWEIPAAATTNVQLVIGSGSTGATQATWKWRSAWL